MRIAKKPRVCITSRVFEVILVTHILNSTTFFGLVEKKMKNCQFSLAFSCQ